MHDVELGLEVLLDDPHPALWDMYARREVLRFLRKRGQEIRRECLKRLTEAILKGPPRHLYRDDLTDENWTILRENEIRLRLYKLTESGTSLPASAQEFYDRIQSNRPWHPNGDHSEEFSFFVSSGGGNFVDQNDTAKVEEFDDMSTGEFIRWSETQIGEPWECGGGWRRFVENDFKASVKLLKNAAGRKVWPVAPWFTVLGSFGSNEEGNIVSGTEHELAVLLIKMPTEIAAKLDLQTARWLEGTAQKIGKNERRGLWGRVWSASLLNNDPQDDLGLDTALNHAGGVLGNILYREMVELIPRVSHGQTPGIPSELCTDFEKIAAEDHPSAKLARVRIAAMLVFLYRIDPDWTERAFFCRMNPDNESTFEPRLWEGFLWSARWSPDLLKAFKPLLLKVLGDLRQIPDRVRDRAVGLFIHMAVPPDRGIDSGDAKSALWRLGCKELSVAAEALGDILKGAGDKSSVLWRDTIDHWFATVWPRRKQDRSKGLSQALAKMAIDSGNAFPDVVGAIQDILTPEQYNYALYRLNQTDVATRHPEAALTLVDKIVGDDGHANDDILREVLKSISEHRADLMRTDSFKRLANLANTGMH